MLLKYLDKKARFFSQRNLLTNVYGLGRSLLALGTLITFTFNDSNILFSSAPEHYNLISESVFARVGLFSLLFHHAELARIISIIILLFSVSGWRPRLVGLFHWYITYSFFLACDYYDGGDQVASILTLLLIPFCLCDKREWVWNKPTENGLNVEIIKTRNIFLNTLYNVIRLQVCIIYLHAAIAKMNVNDWLNGTATYYWFTNHTFGASDWLRPLIILLMSKSYIVVPVTWGTMIFEIILAMAIMMKRNGHNWKILLMTGILFHLGIIIIHGLISFFFAMTASLILYLYPLDKLIIFEKFRLFNREHVQSKNNEIIIK